jgi:hypothetical protein
MESKPGSPSKPQLSKQWTSALTIPNRYVLPLHPSWGETNLNNQDTNAYFEKIQEKGGHLFFKYKKTKLLEVDEMVKNISNAIAEKKSDDVTLDFIAKSLSSAFDSDIERARAVYTW